MKLPWKPLAAATAAIGILAITTVIHPLPRVIWNASASVPIGLYAVDPRRSPERMDIAVVHPPEPLARFLSEGGYLPEGVPLLKHVAALPPSRPHCSCAPMVFRSRSLRPATQIEFSKFSSPIQRAWGVTKRHRLPLPMHRRCFETIHLSPPGLHRRRLRQRLPVGRSSRPKAPFSLRATRPGPRNEAPPAKSCPGQPSAAMAYCRR